eukprot:3374309-Alexandrium_andersonii.AAC.1
MAISDSGSASKSCPDPPRTGRRTSAGAGRRPGRGVSAPQGTSSQPAPASRWARPSAHHPAGSDRARA